jgi:hypothetical protein
MLPRQLHPGSTWSPIPRCTRADFALPFLIDRCALRQPRADRRLNAIENILATLTRSWRRGQPIIHPATDLRMSTSTCDALLDWVRQAQPDGGLARSRILVYQSAPVIDPTVPDGWLRVLLAR